MISHFSEASVSVIEGSVTVHLGSEYNHAYSFHDVADVITHDRKKAPLFH